MTEHLSPTELFSPAEQAVINVSDAIQAWGRRSFQLKHGAQTYDFSFQHKDPLGTESDYGVMIYADTPVAAAMFEGGVRVSNGQRRGISREPLFEEQWGEEEIEIVVQPDDTEEEGKRRISSNPIRTMGQDNFAQHAPFIIELLMTNNILGK